MDKPVRHVLEGNRVSTVTPVPTPSVTPVGSVPDGKVSDFLTGKFVNDTPEEYVRQNIEKAAGPEGFIMPKPVPRSSAITWFWKRYYPFVTELAADGVLECVYVPNASSQRARRRSSSRCSWPRCVFVTSAVMCQPSRSFGVARRDAGAPSGR